MIFFGAKTIFVVFVIFFDGFCCSPTVSSTPPSTTEKPRSLFYRIFYPLLPWRRTTTLTPLTTTSMPVPRSVREHASGSTVTEESEVEMILQAIETPSYRINNGSLSLNDTELVVVENGSESFRIIDDENMIMVNDSSHSSTPPPTTPKPQPHRRLPTQTTTPKCEKLTEKQKYAKLESIGGRNQQFMANTPEEASKNFPHLTPPEPHSSVKNEHFAKVMMSDAVKEDLDVNPGYCDETCEEIKLKLEDAVDSRKKHKSAKISSFRIRLADSGPAEVQEGNSDGKGGCFLEKFVAIGNCTSRGDEELWGYEKLCTACPGVYMLSDGCFPTFFNSITCDNDEKDCIFDQYTSAAHGKCQAKTISFKIMRNKGTKECEEWVFEYINVPIACECFLSKSSFLHSMPEL